MIRPTQEATKDPNYDRWLINLLYLLGRMTCSLRALIPVGRDPMQVEVDCGPENISDPSVVVLFRFEEPISVLD